LRWITLITASAHRELIVAIGLSFLQLYGYRYLHLSIHGLVRRSCASVVCVFSNFHDCSRPCRGSDGASRSVLTKFFDAEEFRKQAHQMVDFIADYHRDIENFPVRSQVEVRF
jgi:hypothetical protein